MASKTLSIRYTADASGVTRAQATIERGAQSLGQKMQTLGRSMYRTGRMATVGLTLPIVAGFKIAIDEAAQFNQVQGQTQAAMKSTGGAANVTIGHIDALSASIGKLTAQDGEVVQSMENILLTFPSIRNEMGKGNAIFDRTSKAVADVSARMGTDLNAAALQVGKALANPIKGLSALTRVGVQFSDEQIKMVTHLVNTGNIMGAQKIILGELTKEFGGSAKAMGDAASPLTKLNLAFRDFAQQIGPTVIKMVEGLTKVLSAVFRWFEGLSDGTKKWVVYLLAAVAAVGPLLIVVGALVTTIAAMALATGVVIAAIAAVIAITILLIANWGTVKSLAQTVWNAVEHAVGKAIGKMIGYFATFLSIIITVYQSILHGAAVAFGWIPGIGSKLKAADAAFTKWKNSLIDGLRATADHFQTFGSTAARATAKANEQMQQLNATLLEVARHSHIHVVIDQTGALHGGIQHRAMGGPVSRGVPYWINEKGPELFIPDQNGRISPHGGSLGAGGAAAVVNVYVAGSVVSERDLVEVVRKGLVKVGARNGGTTGI